ncbi:MAG TPA: alkyl sulfatase dimerization domain-containing protein [Actinomycetota bacterium]|nr:alkyl sulfatase dimerization domain-containing protein [Actinomycetota bacterium]
MSEDLLEIADSIWSGEVSMEEKHPMAIPGQLLEVRPGVAFVSGFSNAIAFDTGDGLVLIDSGGFLQPDYVHGHVRGWSDQPLRFAIYTHGHVDHVFGVGPFDSEPGEPVVIGHENVPPRFDRYVLTAGYNSVINQRQFQVPGLQWPTEYRFPDITYRDDYVLEHGDLRFELYHAKGETDDHTWVWVPDRRVLCCGDLFIWCSPNAGNPQKVQRYPREWAEALRAMQDVGAEVLLPGHGLPVVGTARIQEALDSTASYLESICDQSLALMNEGLSLDEIVARVEPPAELAAKPFLQPIYDEPDFIVRNLWRLYAGWYDGDASRLKPSAPGELDSALVGLVGGVEPLVAEARRRADAGELALACELIEIAHAAAPDDADVKTARSDIYARRSKVERSTMAKGVYAWAAAESSASG